MASFKDLFGSIFGSEKTQDESSSSVGKRVSADTSEEVTGSKTVGTTAGQATGAQETASRTDLSQLGPEVIKSLNAAITGSADSTTKALAGINPEELADAQTTSAVREFNKVVLPGIQSTANRVGGSSKTNSLVGELERYAGEDLAKTIAGTVAQSKLQAAGVLSDSLARLTTAVKGGEGSQVVKASQSETSETEQVTETVQQEEILKLVRSLVETEESGTGSANIGDTGSIFDLIGALTGGQRL